MSAVDTTTATSWHGPVAGAPVSLSHRERCTAGTHLTDGAPYRPTSISFATKAVNGRPTRRGAPPH